MPETTFSDDQFSQLIDALRGRREDEIEVQAETQARAMKRALHPVNDTEPNVSVYNPRGERDHPRPDLKCLFFFGPYPLEKQTLLLREIDLLNQLEPGQYDVTKADGQVIPFHVKGDYLLDGKSLEKITIWFPCSGDDNRHNFPPLAAMLREVLDQIEVRQLTGAAR